MKSLRSVNDVLVGSAMLAAVGWLDLLTGTELHVYPLYFAPVSWLSWKAARGYGIVAASVSAVAWGIANMTMAETELGAFLFDIVAQASAFLLVALLLSRLRAQVERERELARTDGLTGLPNSRAFLERLEQELARAKRDGRPLALAYLDLDDFKQVNDRLGHLAGDALLQAAATALRGALRTEDTAARLGGDEFAVLLVADAPDAARHAAERALVAVKAAVVGAGADVSIGVAFFRSPPDDANTLVTAADHLMYEAKQAGRGRVVVLEMGTAEPAEPETSVGGG